MEITLLVSPTGSITLHCDEPFTHKLIALDQLENEIDSLIELRKTAEHKEEEERQFVETFESQG